MTTKITAPVRQEGSHSSTFGNRTITFEDGVATVDFEIGDGLKAYLLSNGYGLGSTKAREPEPDPEPADPRDPEVVQAGGTPLRDAAVEPHDTDYLPPTNAGEANPHGPLVVAPEIHAAHGPGPIVPGTVGSPPYQQAKETAAADGTRVDGGAPVPEVTAHLNAIARAEYAESDELGNAGELTGPPEKHHYTPEERELLGLDDIDEGGPADPAPEPEAVPEPIDSESDTPVEADQVDDAEQVQTVAEALEDADLDPGETPVPASELKGDALTDALKAAGLPLTGSADEKRARLAEHRGF